MPEFAGSDRSLDAALISEVQVEVVNRDESRKEVRENADRIVFTENEIGEKAERAGEAEIPEGARDDRFLVLAGGVHLNEPASGKHRDACVTDEFHRRDGEPGD